MLGGVLGSFGLGNFLLGAAGAPAVGLIQQFRAEIARGQSYAALIGP